MINLRDHKKLFVLGKRFASFTCILVMLLLVFSCNNLFISGGGSLIISTPGARAVTGNEIYTIELTGSNGATQSKTVSGGSTVQFDDLAPDTYHIVVEGIDTNNKVVVGGASSATVTAGTTASATVNLVEGVSDFTGLEEAVAAGDTVYVLKSIDVEKTLSISNTVTIVPAYQDVTLKNTGSGNLFTVSTNGNLTIGGGEHTITLDGNKVAQSIIQMTAGTATLADNGIITNAAASGVKITNGTFEMTGGTIMNNTSSSGGAVSLQVGTFKMSGGILKDNESSGVGGAIHMISGICTITGGSITGNTATSSGGGVSVNGGTFGLAGGSISNNSASNGSGVYMHTGSFDMSGSAVIDLSNDVWLRNTYSISISGSLTGSTPVARITPETYSTDTQVLKAENGVTLANEVGKFAVTPNPADGSEWIIDTAGKLQEGVCVSDFASLENAISAGGTVYITKAITMERTLDINKEVTLLSSTQSVVLTGLNPGNLFTVSTGGDLTIGDADHSITLDGNKKSSQIISVDDGGIVTLANGTITNANASGVYINAGGTFNMTGGSIIGNATSNGGGVYVNTGATFTMSGSAIVNEDNDVYLSEGSTISVSDDLSGDTVAKITPYTYETNIVDVFVLSGSIDSNPSICDKFIVTPAPDSSNYKVGTTGKLEWTV